MRPTRREKRAEAGALDPPATGPKTLDRSAQRLARLARPEDVVALEQPLDHRLAAAEQAENEGAMRNRLVARRADAPLEGPAAHGAEGRGWNGAREGNRHEEARISAVAPGKRRRLVPLEKGAVDRP
jgi:hypothetical protein